MAEAPTEADARAARERFRAEFDAKYPKATAKLDRDWNALTAFYDTVVEALGGHGELVREPGELRGALDRAFSAGRPALVNVLTDPSIAYPRRANLA